MANQTTLTWLKILAGVVIFFGVYVALAAHPATAGLVAPVVDMIVWPINGAETFAASEARLISAIGGGVMAGWGVLLWLVATRLYAREPALAKSMILWSIGVWFVIDSIGSVAAGAPLNVLLNLTFPIAFAAAFLPSRQTANA